MTYKHNNEHFPIQANISALIDDYSLFRTTSSNHYIDTQFWRIHNYPLGDGNFGVVNLGTHKTGGIQVAIKTIDSRTSSGQTWRERLNHEVGNVRSLKHPNVIKWLDQIKESGRTPSEDEGRDENEQAWDWSSEGIWKAHLVFELATGGDLFSYLEYKESISEDETKFLTWQLVKGINHIHSHDIAHRGKLSASIARARCQAELQISSSKTSSSIHERAFPESSLGISVYQSLWPA